MTRSAGSERGNRNTTKRLGLRIARLALPAVALGAVGCSGTASAPSKAEPAVVSAPAPTVASVGVAVQPSAQLRSLAAAPRKNVKSRGTASAAGTGQTRASTANSKGDTDVTWIEEIDLDGDGQVETAMLLWDDEDRVLYVATRDALACKDGSGKHKGSDERGGVLIAVYGAGNPYGKPAGSGWYAVYLDAGQCQAQVAGIYGCDFDPAGKSSVCGVVVIDEKNDAIVIAAQRVG